jgi:hypothetical protein
VSVKKYFTKEAKHHARMYQAATSKKTRLRRGLCTSCPRKRERKDRLQCDRCRRKWNRIQKRLYREREGLERAKATIQRGLRKLIRAIGKEAALDFILERTAA